MGSRGSDSRYVTGINAASWNPRMALPANATDTTITRTTAVVLVMVVSVAFAGNAIRGFQEAALIPVTYLESLPRAPIFLAHLTGWYPTRETILAQGLLTLVYVLGAIWTFVMIPRREKRFASSDDTPSIAIDRESEKASVS